MSLSITPIIHVYVYHVYSIFHRPKHPLKVHVWAGISMQGRAAICICIFEGIMKKELFVEILRSSLLPTIQALYPNGHRLMQDNDPKHTSRYALQWMADNGVNWWKTPPESSDINPIENLWHELKEFIRREVKPKVKQELIDGILAFWNLVDREKCRRYIRHLRKVLPKIIEVNGCATGY